MAGLSRRGISLMHAPCVTFLPCSTGRSPSRSRQSGRPHNHSPVLAAFDGPVSQCSSEHACCHFVTLITTQIEEDPFKVAIA